MNTTDWLRRQVGKLAEEIRASSVFDDESPATADQLTELRRKVVLHTWLRQQLLRREPLLLPEELDTQELILVRER